MAIYFCNRVLAARYIGIILSNIGSCHRDCKLPQFNDKKGMKLFVFILLSFSIIGTIVFETSYYGVRQMYSTCYLRCVGGRFAKVMPTNGSQCSSLLSTLAHRLVAHDRLLLTTPLFTLYPCRSNTVRWS